MCIMCDPAFADAFRNFSFPSRRQILKSAAAMTATAMVCEAVKPATALAETASFQDMLDQLDPKELPRATIYRAKEIITLDPARPTATAVAVLGDRILAVGTVDELKARCKDETGLEPPETPVFLNWFKKSGSQQAAE